MVETPATRRGFIPSGKIRGFEVAKTRDAQRPPLASYVKLCQPDPAYLSVCASMFFAVIVKSLW